MLKKLLLAALALAVVAVTGLFLAARASREPLTLGPVDGRLRPAPETPNCVTSQGGTGDAAVEPLARGPQAAAALEAMAQLVEARADLTLVQRTPVYLHATARTALFGFVDDLELLLDREAQVLHVRSASRVGRSDLGANAARVAELRIALQERLAR